MKVGDLLRDVGVLPVLTVDTVEEALGLCRALHRGGVTAVEITLRTSVAVEAVGAVMEALPDLRVGGGTVIQVRDLERLSICGADFAVSPGYTESLTRCAREFGLPFLPGVATPSEILAGVELGLECFKLFPAAALGGTAFLRAMQGPFPHVRFCPTGGIDAETSSDYRSLSNVLCVGGTWLAPPELVKAQRWDDIERLTRRSLAKAG